MEGQAGGISVEKRDVVNIAELCGEETLEQLGIPADLFREVFKE